MKIPKKKKLSAEKILTILNEYFPNPEVPLHHTSPYTLLIAVLLSARCTDERVNIVTKTLFRQADTPEKMSLLSLEEVEALIKPCGFYHNKAKYIKELSKILVQNYPHRIPNNFEELEALPGIGHKSASVLMSQVYHVPAFPVDTHIHRLAKRWGISSGKNVSVTEKDLKNYFPKESWNKLHLQMIYFGRLYCPARGHIRENCPICQKL